MKTSQPGENERQRHRTKTIHWDGGQREVTCGGWWTGKELVLFTCSSCALVTVNFSECVSHVYVTCKKGKEQYQVALLLPSSHPLTQALPWDYLGRQGSQKRPLLVWLWDVGGG